MICETQVPSARGVRWYRSDGVLFPLSHGVRRVSHLLPLRHRLARVALRATVVVLTRLNPAATLFMSRRPGVLRRRFRALDN